MAWFFLFFFPHFIHGGFAKKKKKNPAGGELRLPVRGAHCPKPGGLKIIGPPKFFPHGDGPGGGGGKLNVGPRRGWEKTVFSLFSPCFSCREKPKSVFGGIIGKNN